MALRVKKEGVWGALVLCGTLLGCIREDALYPILSALPTPPQTLAPVVAAEQTPVEVQPTPEEPEKESPKTTVPAKVDAPPLQEKEPVQQPLEIPLSSEAQPLSPAQPPAPSPEPPQKTVKKIRGIHTYFVNREVRSDNVRMFPRWTGMLARYSAENHTLDKVCGSERDQPCKLKEWKSFLEGLRNAPLMEKIVEVNRLVNKYPYVDDILNYWETPYEFQRRSGNCKDYAIAKYLSLRAIGVPDDIMRITVLRDLNLGGVIHAVLVVTVDEKNYILDNQIKQVVSTDKIYHYVPIYSINEEHWWQHFMLD
ncbi:MAG: transglutaminase-like cysteine peptidase [Alphaproteobacteria bacterium]|nr:transglutaminase-like cysteine peptidase [Alphaproteobacteria bacterium]